MIQMTDAKVRGFHRVGDKVKAFKPASFLNPSNSRGLKLGLISFFLPMLNFLFIPIAFKFSVKQKNDDAKIGLLL